MTQLTSTTEAQLREEQNIQTSIEEAVLHYARLAHKSWVGWCRVLTA